MRAICEEIWMYFGQFKTQNHILKVGNFSEREKLGIIILSVKQLIQSDDHIIIFSQTKKFNTI